MKCRKLYYEDCDLRTFTAAVTGCSQTEKGFEITLDATAFYPEGGGQACDLGALGSVNVLDVRERGEAIVHLCDGPLPVGEQVAGAIDWERRFDLMQQHTGEHILSGLIHGKFGWHNVGFHIGTGMMEVDFDGPITPGELAQLEASANAIVWENRPVKCWYPSPEALETVTYRSKKALPWPVRIVQVPGADSCACCGVHVASTAQVGLIKIISSMKFHGGVRIEMVCGGRAFRYLSEVFEQNRQVSQTFSAKMLETGAAAQKVSDALTSEKFRTAALRRRIFDIIAAGYARQKNVVHFEPELESAQVRELAEKIAGACEGFAAVFSGEDSRYSYCLAQPGGDLRQLCKDMNAALNGRGGGKPPFQQGTVNAAKAQIEEFFTPPFVTCVNSFR